MSTESNIIQVENLTVAFGGFKAVDGISFEVKRGEIFGFLGANGAGKTTTIRCICGLLNPTSGTVKVDGKDVSSSTSVLKPRIGYMSQKFTLYPDLTVKENLAFAGSLYGLKRKQIKARAEELMRFIGLTQHLNEPVKLLSGGVKQVVALAATLLHEPDLVFLDEPTAGTSPATRADFWRLIRTLAQNGKTVFVTTHYMDEAEYCGRIVLMERGKIIATGTPQELKEQFFPQPPVELVFSRPEISRVRAELERTNIGEAENFSGGLRVRVNDWARFEAYAKEQAGVFAFHPVEPTLEDVFLKAVSGRKGA